MKDSKSYSTGIFIVIIIALGGVIWYFTSSNALSLGGASSLKSPQTLSVGETKLIEGLSVTPKQVTEDSRCPQGVNCIWAGRVVASVTLSADGEIKTGPLVLGEAVPFGNFKVTLSEVAPAKKQGGEIKPSDYRLTFEVERTSNGSGTLESKSYSNDKYGFSFTYPESYIVQTHDESVQGRDHYSVVLTEAVGGAGANGKDNPPGEGPVSITIEVFKDQISNPNLMSWLKDTPGSNFNLSNGKYEASKLGGKTAVSYHWSGLYENDTTAAAGSGYILSATVSYIAKTDPIVDVYKNLISTLVFK